MEIPKFFISLRFQSFVGGVIVRASVVANPNFISDICQQEGQILTRAWVLSDPIVSTVTSPMHEQNWSLPKLKCPGVIVIIKFSIISHLDISHVQSWGVINCILRLSSCLKVIFIPFHPHAPKPVAIHCLHLSIVNLVLIKFCLFLPQVEISNNWSRENARNTKSDKHIF